MLVKTIYHGYLHMKSNVICLQVKTNEFWILINIIYKHMHIRLMDM